MQLLESMRLSPISFPSNASKNDASRVWRGHPCAITNRLLRKYFPPGLDMSTHSQAKLSAVAGELNERRRKTLQYQTPAEKFEQCVAAIR